MESPTVAPDADESLSSSDLSEISALDRANRFQGPPSTWRNLTTDDRLVPTSLIRLRNRDLSIHLYNAHAMKRRLYGNEIVSISKPWAGKDRWRGDRPGDQDEGGDNFVPPKFWTAWPLSADIIPRTGEQVGQSDSTEEWTLKRGELQMPSRELEEILIAITLRICKDRFGGRELTSENDMGRGDNGRNHRDTGSNGGVENEYEMANREPLPKIAHNSLRISREAMSEMIYASQNTFDQADKDGTMRNQSQKAEETLDELSNEGSETSSKNVIILERPIVSADDEKSGRLLRPTIRHTLSQLDDLLMAMHHARQSCFHYGSEHTESQSDFESGDMDIDVDVNNDPLDQANIVTLTDKALEQPPKRLRPGRPPKLVHMPAPSERDALETIEPRKGSNRGRKRKIHVPLKGESQEEMLIRIARLQKKAIPFTVPTIGPASLSPAKPAQGSPQRRGTSAQAREKRSTRLGLRDWSEVLGTAALIGFPSNVINRATQRCTSLFGEGMTIHALVENPKMGNEDRIVDYLPSEIPDFDSLYSSLGNESEADDEGHSKTGRRPLRSRNRSNQHSSVDTINIKNSDSDGSTSSEADAIHHCPYPACLRHKKGFTQKLFLSNHLERVHKVDKQERRKVTEDSGEEMEGGVHVDGFMLEIKRRTGWRALDGKPRQRKSSMRISLAEEQPGAHEGGPDVDMPSIKSSSGPDLGERSFDEAFKSD